MCVVTCLVNHQLCVWCGHMHGQPSVMCVVWSHAWSAISHMLWSAICYVPKGGGGGGGGFSESLGYTLVDRRGLYQISSVAALVMT